MLRPALALIAVAGCAPDLEAGQVDGPTIFAARCATCHGATGKPDEGMVVRYNVRDLTAPAFRARVTVERVADQVRGGSDNKLMPGFDGVLSDAQIRAVAEYVTRLPAP